MLMLEEAKVRASEHQPTAREVATSPASIFETRVKLLVLATLYSFDIVSFLAAHSVTSITVEAALYCTMPTDIRSFFGGNPVQSSQNKTSAKVEVRFIISRRPSYLNIRLQYGLFSPSTPRFCFHPNSDAQAGKKIKGSKIKSSRR